MLASLLKYQNRDGTWNQLIDHPEAWPETSSTGMFAFAMITGVKNGWLEKKTYAPAARKAWLGLIHYIDANGDVSNVCEGTNKEERPELLSHPSAQHRRPARRSANSMVGFSITAIKCFM